MQRIEYIYIIQLQSAKDWVQIYNSVTKYTAKDWVSTLFNYFVLSLVYIILLSSLPTLLESDACVPSLFTYQGTRLIYDLNIHSISFVSNLKTSEFCLLHWCFWICSLYETVNTVLCSIGAVLPENKVYLFISMQFGFMLKMEVPRALPCP